LEKANDFIRDITAAAFKIACNRRVDDAGNNNNMMSIIYSTGGRCRTTWEKEIEKGRKVIN